ncbi:DUF2590 family protein [Moritella viscosa]|uniref:Putative phage protein n=1 Tax=Moritella viscosa TaxID=80854 RepID=A0A1L0AHZ8_9GAMM|nr:DUF2590 family protein [Moritella viscosa]SGZ15461.1 Putative phage gene [Moritella viscosa]SGZ20581.1 Putative phage gene [Moritella viscosa]SHO24775.1 Putative phage gene [Moritella viscosa]
MINMHVDLNIIDGDFVFNSSLSAGKLSAAKVIGQDVKHRIIESGLLVKLVKQRNVNGIAPVLTDLELEVEQDNRLKPGTILISYNSDKTLSIEAQTKQYGVMKWAGA